MQVFAVPVRPALDGEWGRPACLCYTFGAILRIILPVYRLSTSSKQLRPIVNNIILDKKKGNNGPNVLHWRRAPRSTWRCPAVPCVRHACELNTKSAFTSLFPNNCCKLTYSCPATKQRTAFAYTCTRCRSGTDLTSLNAGNLVHDPNAAFWLLFVCK